jgi:hypothetical protein
MLHAFPVACFISAATCRRQQRRGKGGGHLAGESAMPDTHARSPVAPSGSRRSTTQLRPLQRQLQQLVYLVRDHAAAPGQLLRRHLHAGSQAATHSGTRCWGGGAVVCCSRLQVLHTPPPPVPSYSSRLCGAGRGRRAERATVQSLRVELQMIVE